MTSSTAPPEENFLGRLDRAFDLFSELDSTHLYLNHVRVFIAVCQGAETYREIEERTGIRQSSISRLTRALSRFNRQGFQGFGLIEMEMHPTDRGLLVSLTRAGKNLKRKLLKA
jgi:DNA-binding MarR family transcriptional regulator